MKRTPLDITPREEIILVILCRAPSYGFELRNILSQMGDEFDWGDGTLYPILHRLTKAKMLREVEVQDLMNKRGGRSRKYYEVTKDGWNMLHKIRQLREIWDDRLS